MIEGKFEQKTKLIFDMISSKKEVFSLEDLFQFYDMVDDEDLTQYPALRKRKEKEMRDVSEFIYWSIHEKNTTENITYEVFHAFCLKDPNNLRLFNFLNSDDTEFIGRLKLNSENKELFQKAQKVKEQLNKVQREQTTRFSQLLPFIAQIRLLNWIKCDHNCFQQQQLLKVVSQLD